MYLCRWCTSRWRRTGCLSCGSSSTTAGTGRSTHPFRVMASSIDVTRKILHCIETSFDSKQPKLEPKLVSALSETKCFFRLFPFYTETESFDVSIEPKQTGDQPKKFEREHYFAIFHRKFRVFRIFRFFRFFRLLRFYTKTENFDVSIELKRTEDPLKQFKREYIWEFFRKFRVVSVCFGLLRNSSVCFGCFDIGSKHRNKPKFFVFGFTKQTESNTKQILFRFVSVRTENLFLFVSRNPTHDTNICKSLDSLERMIWPW